jgi:hypothetical protein
MSRWGKTLFPVVLLAGALACAPAASAATLGAQYVGFNHLASRGLSATGTTKSNDAESTNWSGYVATGAAPYTSVSTSWLQPSVNCSTTPNSYAAFWAGIDGDTSDTVEQDGTLAECSGRTAEYYGWYETYPNPMYNFGDTVKPNDLLTAKVVSNSPTSFTLTLSDTPANGSATWSVTTTQTVSSSAALSSAEVIAEAPSSNYGILPLADFGTAQFENPLIGTSPFSGAHGLTPIEMITNSGQPEAIPSAFTNDNFSVAWQAAPSRGFRF